MVKTNIPLQVQRPPRVLVLFPRTSYRAGAFVEAAHRLGIQLVVGTDHRQALASLLPGVSLTLNLYRPKSALRTIEQAHAREPFRAIVGVDEPTVYLAALASERLGLPSNSAEACRTVWLKHLFREAISRAGLPQPRFQLLDLRQAQLLAAPSLPFPVVIKPVFLSASRGVMRVNNEMEFQQAVKHLGQILSEPEVRRKGREMADVILVEEYLPGKEVALEGLLVKGQLHTLALFDKPDPLEGPYFTETIYVTPSRLPEGIQKQVQQTVQEAARAVALHTGPVHAELRINDQGVWLLELAARSIGGRCSEVLRFSGNRRLEELILLEAIGEDVSDFQLEGPAAGVFMIPVPEKGILKAVEHLKEAEQVPGVQRVLITVAREQPVAPLPEGDRYLGFIFARGDNPETVELALREAYRKLKISIHPHTTAS